MQMRIIKIKIKDDATLLDITQLLHDIDNCIKHSYYNYIAIPNED
jgi:hypothetical protein